MAPEKAPAFQFYAKDFLTDGHVAAMSLPELGAYIKLLCLCWQEQSLPVEPSRLANMVGVPNQTFQKLWPAVSECFHAREDGRLVHPRLEKEREKQAHYKRRQSDAGRASATARQPRVNHGSTTVQPEGNHGSTRVATETQVSDLRSPISDLRTKKEERVSLSRMSGTTDEILAERAGRFIERYEALYQKRRSGARYAVRPARDYEAALTLCRTWADDARLDKLAEVFLTTDHEFAESGSRTIPQFLALASWCDGRLADYEAKRRPA